MIGVFKALSDAETSPVRRSAFRRVKNCPNGLYNPEMTGR